MTEEEIRHYADIGLRADIKNKADAVMQGIEHMKEELVKGSGVYVRSRYRSSIDSLIAQLVAFDEAMAKKEALRGDR